MSNILAFPTPAVRDFDRDAAAFERAAALREYQPAAAIEQMIRLCAPGIERTVRLCASVWLGDECGVRVNLAE